MAAGEIVAVLGRSGSGKSTLLHVLGGLDRPEAGVVEVAGERVTGASERRLSAIRRRHIGFVFQFFHLLPELTGEGNVLLAGRACAAPRPEAAARGRALIGRLGLDDVAGSLPHQLSGGEQQRFAIARALVNDPSLLLADEPTGNLDARRGARPCCGCCASLADEGRAVVLVTHEPAAAGIADRRAAARCGPAGAGVRRRRLLAALGIAAASLVAGTAATVGYGLATGFERAADAGRPPARHRALRPRSRARPSTRACARCPTSSRARTGCERRNACIRARGRRDGQGDARLPARRPARLRGRRGPRPARRRARCSSSAGWRRDWGLAAGDRLTRRRPLSAADRRRRARALERRLPAHGHAARVRRCRPGTTRPANVAQLWLADPDRADITLAQARATSFGVGNLTFVTRAGIQVLLGQAAGIVISLLVAFSLVALVAAGTMLAAGAQADVARRLPAFGVQRALGFTPGAAGGAAGGASRCGWRCRRRRSGCAVGALAVAGSSADLLAQLNEQPPGWALRAGARARVAGDRRAGRGRAGPGRRGGRRGGRRRRSCGAATRRGGSRAGVPASLLALGARLAAARARRATRRRSRVLAVCVGVLTLMLALASLLERLRDDPETIGKRYELTVRLDPILEPDVAAIPGVADVAPRYQVEVADSFRLGEPLRLVAFPGDHTAFEAPPLAEGRRRARAGRGGGRARAGRRARAAAGRDARGAARGRGRGRASAWSASCARWSATGGSPTCSRTGCSTPTRRSAAAASP